MTPSPMSASPIGRFRRLPILRFEAQGAYLEEPGLEGGEVLLPARFVPDGANLGDTVDVFVYTDSEDRPVATTQEPRGAVGDFAFLRVVDQTVHGSFLDWGLDKDLFAPRDEQWGELAVGDARVFAIVLHEKTQRVMAASRLGRHFDYDVEHVRHGDQVTLLVYEQTALGFRVVVDGRHTGLIYKSECFVPLKIGDSLDGWVHAVRDDNKLDIRLQRSGQAGVGDAESVILSAIDEDGGFLPLHDKSAPAAIKARLGISKKVFKKAVGGLYRRRKVELVDGGIRRIKKV